MGAFGRFRSGMGGGIALYIHWKSGKRSAVSLALPWAWRRGRPEMVAGWLVGGGFVRNWVRTSLVGRCVSFM